jgi:F-type H+-transporting ATPase subunit gamma
MPSLKEIKGRITSVGGTLKITSAMKLVASAKLHKAQAAIEGALPYQQQLEGIMRMAVSGEVRHPLCTPHADRKTVALISIASNTSLCGGYNAGVIRQTVAALEQYREEGLRVRLIVMGRKPDQALVKWAKGQGSWLSLERDYVERGDKPAYADASRLALSLAGDFLGGRLDGVELIYMHFKNTASQVLTREALLPLSLNVGEAGEEASANIMEPSREALLQALVPDALAMKMYTVMLDAQAAEHAARTVAMQTATDNANELLDELRIQYNKGRQAAITSELLDIVGGSMQ